MNVHFKQNSAKQELLSMSHGLLICIAITSYYKLR